MLLHDSSVVVIVVIHLYTIQKSSDYILINNVIEFIII
jgi:hypothetical protein